MTNPDALSLMRLILNQQALIFELLQVKTATLAPALPPVPAPPPPRPKPRQYGMVAALDLGRERQPKCSLISTHPLFYSRMEVSNVPASA